MQHKMTGRQWECCGLARYGRTRRYVGGLERDAEARAAATQTVCLRDAVREREIR
jgi:hypothetical protein